MNGWWTSVVGGSLLLVACGQTTSPNADSSAEDPRGGTSPGGATPSPAGGSSAGHSTGGSGLGGQRDVPPDPEGAAGTPSTEPNESDPHPAIPCEDPQPFPSGGGFEQCADGTVRRLEPADCITAVPRSEPVAGRLYEECAYDADCTEHPRGYCVIGACFYGCVVDSDCGEHEICACGDPIGTCQLGCAGDASCEAEYPCTGVLNAGQIEELFCQSPYDECVSDQDCNKFDSKMHCEADPIVGARRCIRRIIG